MQNFFELQDRARRNTGWLVILFIIAVLGIAAGVYFAVMLILRHPAMRQAAHRASQELPTSWWNADIFLSFFIGTLLIIIFASLLRSASLRSGGSAVAEMLGARRVPPGTTDPYERRLLNVVEEMSIASSVPVPQVYILENEPGINAFAAGHKPADAAVVATRGAIEKLNRDELQGVMAHEFGHLLNGDMRLKLQLMGVVFGILVISVIGRGMLQMMRFSGRSSRRGQGGAVLIFVVGGLALMILGYIGLFCGRLIKAAVSRQREYLADSSSVQFTRNPQGIAGALKKIGGYVYGSRVQAPRTEEASHFFFSSAVSYSVFSGLFATHPPLDERIRRIDPSFDGRFPEVGEEPAPVTEPTREAAAAAGATAAPASFVLDPAAIVEQVGRPSPEHTDYASALLRQIPPAVADAVRDPFSAAGLVYATLLSDDQSIQAKQVEWIRAHAGEHFLVETRRLAAALTGFDPRWRFAAAKLMLPALRSMTPAQHEDFARTIEGLIEADKTVTAFEYALSRGVLRSLAASRGKKEEGRIKSLRDVRDDCRALLSILARSGHADEHEAQRAYRSGADRLGALLAGADLLGPQPLAETLDRTLANLQRTTPKLRQMIIDACAHCVLADRQVTVDEAELLRAVADMLESPLPPFLPAVA